MSTLFVGNLSFRIKDDELKSFFSDKGYTPESVRVIVNEGRSKGYGYAEFSSPEQAKEALREFNGRDLDGRELRLDMATPRGNAGGDGGYRAPRGGRGDQRGGRGGRGGGANPGPSNKLYVRNLWLDTETSTLEELFPEANNVYLPKDRDSGRPRGFGFITFDDVETATTALENMDGTDVDGYNIELRYAEDRGSGGRGGSSGVRRGGRGRGRYDD